jgi:hypothetical protein
MQPPRSISALRLRRLAAAGVLVLAAAGTTPVRSQAALEAEAAPAPVPGFAELEAAGARFGEIRIVAREIFDTDDPAEDKLLFRWANALHVRTRPGVVERALLFKTGDPVSVRVIEETERLLRGVRYVYDVRFRPVALRDGVVDVEVETRDTWSLDPGFSASRSGGSTSSGIRVRDYNLFGTGMSVSLGRSRNVDRSSNEFQFSNDRAFGSWISLGFSHAQNSDGRRNTASVVRPFYALDARWSAGVSLLREDRIDAVYDGGNIASRYRHRQDRTEVFGGWSQGLVDGWVQRFSLGLVARDDAFAVAPGLLAPLALPADEKLVGPFLRHEWIEDRFQKELNRNLIGRPEYFALGFSSRLELGWAGTRWGSTRNTWIYDFAASRGFEPAADQTLIVAARASGKRSDGESRQVLVGGQLQYYRPQSPRWLFYASGAIDTLSHADAGEPLQLGGDNGLRGYPLRYQSGTHRALFTAEERFYTDLYVWRLFRIGGAAFFDAGRAWGGDDASRADNGWLRNAGVGLRIVSVRAAFSNVLHVDLAFPLDPTTGVKRVQFLVKTRTSF